MKQIFLLGDPVAHSKSPTFQNVGIRERGLDAHYACRHTTSVDAMRGAADECREGAIHGANITLPYKAVAAELADIATPEVEVAGVANTWWSAAGVLHADNTDIYGIQASIAALNASSLDDIVILGAGGAAVGALFSLRNVARTVSIVNRTLATADLLAAKASVFMEAEVSAFAWPDRGTPQDSLVMDRFRDADLIVQATSLPVHRSTDSKPFEVFPWESLRTSSCLLELCYSSDPTIAVRQAEANRLRALDGATMLLHQGLKSFERWFKVEAPSVPMRDALAAVLGRSASDIPAIPDRMLLERLRGAEH